MSVPLNPLLNRLLKPEGSGSPNSLKNFVSGKIERNISPFKFSLTTDFGLLEIGSKKGLSPGDIIKIEVALSGKDLVFNSGEKGVEPGKDFFNNVFKQLNNSNGGKTVLNAVVKEMTALPKFRVSTEMGSVLIESESFLKDGEIVKLNPLQVKKALLTTVEEKGFQNLSESDKPTGFPLKEILKLIAKNPLKISGEIFSRMDRMEKKHVGKNIENIIKNIIDPEKIDSSAIKKGVKYFFGSSFKNFKSDFKDFENFIRKFEDFEKDYKPEKTLVKNSKEVVELTSKGKNFIEGMENQKNLNLIKFAESSKLYFFLPFSGRDFESAEFFYDGGSGSNDEPENKQLRALVKLRMSRLGTIKADLRLIGERVVKIYFSVEEDRVKNILSEGFDFLEKNLKKSGFKDVFLFIDSVQKQKDDESLLVNLIDVDSDDSIFNIRI